MNEDRAWQTSLDVLNTLRECAADLALIRQHERGSREHSIAQTELETAILWLQEGINKQQEQRNVPALQK